MALNNKNLDFISVFFVLSIFTKEIFTVKIGGMMIDFFSYTFFVLYFVFNLRNFKMYKPYVILNLVISISAIISILTFNYDYKLFLKTFLPIVIIFTSTFDILYKRMDKLFFVFVFYLKVSFYVAVFGLIQWVLSLFGINILIKQPGLLDSIAYEPSHYAVIILPAAIYYIKNYRGNFKEVVVIILSLFLTFSFTSYIVLVFTLLIPIFNFRNLIKILSVVSLVFILSKYLPDRVLDRVESLNEFYVFDEDYRDPTFNLTITSFASNLDVAMYSLNKNFITGSGIGLHSVLYEEYFKVDSYFNSHPWFGINSISAHSLTIRILSELGILGFFIYMLFLFRSYIKPFEKHDYHIISLAILSHFFAKTLKLGGYIDYGTPVFISFLIINKLRYRITLKTQDLSRQTNCE